MTYDDQLREILKQTCHDMSGTPMHNMAGWGFGVQIAAIKALVAALPAMQDEAVSVGLGPAKYITHEVRNDLRAQIRRELNIGETDESE